MRKESLLGDTERQLRERKMFESTEQSVCDQAKTIRKNGWLSEFELEAKKSKRKLSELNERYRVKRKGLKTVTEELQQKMLAKSAKVRRYQQRIDEFRQNRIFDFDQKKMYAELNGDGIRPSDVLNTEESKRFWGDIWSVGKGHNREAEWLKDIKIELGNDKHLQERVIISLEKVIKQCRKIPNWKAPGKDGVQSY